jgi:hypothetical protein
VYRILTGKTLQLPEDEPDITDTEINALLQVDIGGPPPPHQDKIIKVAFNSSVYFLPLLRFRNDLVRIRILPLKIGQLGHSQILFVHSMTTAFLFYFLRK